MKALLFVLALLLVCGILFVGCPKVIRVKPPEQTDITVGPTHKRLEINNRNGKRLLNIDVFEDNKNIQVRPQGEVEIRPSR